MYSDKNIHLNVTSSNTQIESYINTLINLNEKKIMFIVSYESVDEVKQIS